MKKLLYIIGFTILTVASYYFFEIMPSTAKDNMGTLTMAQDVTTTSLVATIITALVCTTILVLFYFYTTKNAVTNNDI